MKKLFLAAGLCALSSLSASAQVNSLLYGLEAYYPMMGNAQDAIGAAHGTVHGGAQLVPDRNGYSQDAYVFDGTSGYIDLGDNLDNVFTGPNAQFAIAAWVRLTDNDPTWGNNRLIINKSGDSDCPENQRQFYFRYYQGEFNFSFGDLNATWARYVNTTYPATDTLWHHLVILYDANQSGNNGLDRVEFFVDGQPKTSRLMSNSFGVLGHMQDGTAHLGIGNRLDSYGQACSAVVPGFFKGGIDDVAIYSRLLTRQEITQLATPNRHGILATAPDKAIAGLFVYPSVSTDGSFQVTLPTSASHLDYRVTNLLGQVVQRGRVDATATKIQLANPAKGSYLVTFSNSQQVATHRVVVD